jgi:hypothetical protein
LYYAFTLCARNLPAKLEIYGLATLKLLTGSERYSDLLGFKNESIATQQLRKEGKGSITQARHLRPCNVKIAEWWTRFLSHSSSFFQSADKFENASEKIKPHQLSACARKGPFPKNKKLDRSRNETRRLKNKTKKESARTWLIPERLLTCGSTTCRSSWAHAASQARIYGLTTGVVDWQHFTARRSPETKGR